MDGGEGQGTPKPAEGLTEPSSDPETFPASYVKELRDENAKARTKAKRADDLARLLVTAYAGSTGKLADPEDLPWSDDFLNDDGLPDAEKVSAAVADLIEKKPHLAAIRPTGDVGQGARGPEGHMVSLGDLLRANA